MEAAHKVKERQLSSERAMVEAHDEHYIAEPKAQR
jgi:hypothetical protein